MPETVQQRLGQLPGQRLRQPGSRVAEDRLARAPAPGAAARRRGQLRRDRRRRADPLRPRARRLLAQLAREPPPLRPHPPRDRARPARLRRQPDALLADRHARLRAADPRLLREARHRPSGGAGRQLDGRLRLDRGDVERPSRFEQAGAGLRRRDQLRRGRRAAARSGGAPVRSGDGVPRRPAPSLARPGPAGRELRLRPVFRYPNRVRPELLREQMEPGSRAPASPTRSARSAATTPATG